MKNDITDILFKYTTGEATLEETNEALKEAEAGFHLEPGKNEITPEEAAQTVTGETPEEVTGYGLLDTGTGSMEKVKIVNGKLGDAINQVNPDGTTNQTLASLPRGARPDFPGGRYEGHEPQHRREANQPGQRMPEGSRGPAWTCQVD